MLPLRCFSGDCSPTVLKSTTCRKGRNQPNTCLLLPPHLLDKIYFCKTIFCSPEKYISLECIDTPLPMLIFWETWFVGAFSCQTNVVMKWCYGIKRNCLVLRVFGGWLEKNKFYLTIRTSHASGPIPETLVFFIINTTWSSSIPSSHLTYWLQFLHRTYLSQVDGLAVLPENQRDDSGIIWNNLLIFFY